eukprot:CAMPEP_0170175346 /NCGR_PEP_ID=MMETSP0040_2-20121228/8431_1 /TAXON_ID=641309 /ORGANISM="Lotharella oceanica, Strain CCMP622" /LENGTH=86 /DNA_ID=CAMNT_0010417295 /DNA_START=710 /DNA_END=970 /DNA_ORIENTATION=-
MINELEKKLTIVKSKMIKFTKKLESKKYRHRATESIQDVLKRVQGKVQAVEGLCRNGVYEGCKDKLWNADADLETLDHILKAKHDY